MKKSSPTARPTKQPSKTPAASISKSSASARTGHIGFNEPGSTRTSRTRLIALDRITRRDARPQNFSAKKTVPRFAITMGVGTILEARKTRSHGLGR